MHVFATIIFRNQSIVRRYSLFLTWNREPVWNPFFETTRDVLYTHGYRNSSRTFRRYNKVHVEFQLLTFIHRAVPQSVSVAAVRPQDHTSQDHFCSISSGWQTFTVSNPSVTMMRLSHSPEREAVRSDLVQDQVAPRWSRPDSRVGRVNEVSEWHHPFLLISHEWIWPPPHHHTHHHSFSRQDEFYLDSEATSPIWVSIGLEIPEPAAKYIPTFKHFDPPSQCTRITRSIGPIVFVCVPGHTLIKESVWRTENEIDESSGWFVVYSNRLLEGGASFVRGSLLPLEDDACCIIKQQSALHERAGVT